MYALSVAQVRSLELAVVAKESISLFDLVRRAGAAVSSCALELAATAGLRRFLILAGKGNNAGDALICAKLLYENGIVPTVCLAYEPGQLRNEAKLAYEELPTALKQKLRNDLPAEALRSDCLVIDGLLGSGTRGRPRPELAAWIESINAGMAPVLAIDLPSGLEADSGQAECAVQADLTLALIAPKIGMLQGRGPELCGRILLDRLGTPHALLQGQYSEWPVFTRYEAEALLKREAYDIHKNMRGHVAVIGGSRQYMQAPFLTAEAALRSGAGLVSVLLPENLPIYAGIPKALILRKLPDAGKGILNQASLSTLQKELTAFSVLACGPGWSKNPALLPVLELLLQSGKPIVLDADALNLLCQAPEILMQSKSAKILTPHPGEMRRLLSAYDLCANLPRHEQALALAQKTGCAILLKGHGSICADPEGIWTRNLSGSAALATAGSGDVLCGICAAFLGQMPKMQAATLAAYLHGLCADRLKPLGSRGLIADDLLAEIPQAITQVNPKA